MTTMFRKCSQCNSTFNDENYEVDCPHHLIGKSLVEVSVEAEQAHKALEGLEKATDDLIQAIVIREKQEEERKKREPIENLLTLLKRLGVSLTNVQREKIERIDAGQTITLRNVTDTRLGGGYIGVPQRLKEDFTDEGRQEGEQQLSTGSLFTDVAMFMQNEFTRCTKQYILQVVADDLGIYLKKRGWNPEHIYDAVNKTIMEIAKGNGDIKENE